MNMLGGWQVRGEWGRGIKYIVVGGEWFLKERKRGGYLRIQYAE